MYFLELDEVAGAVSLQRTTSLSEQRMSCRFYVDVLLMTCHLAQLSLCVSQVHREERVH